MLNYNKESNADKKQLHYTLIMTTQLAGEQKGSVAGSDDPVAKIQYLTALKYMKQSWDAPAVCF